MSPSIRRTIYILTSILVLYIVGIFFIYIFIDYIVFSPVRHSQNQRYSTPEPYKEIKLDHPNGQKFNMLCFKSRSQAKANMLLLHGVAKSADWWSDYVPFFTERGFNVYIPDYRGYGKSEGRATEIGLYEDAQISMGWLRNQTSEDSIVLYGVDLAACVAAYVSTISPCRQVFLENPVYSLRSWMRNRFPLLLLPYELRYDFNLYEFLPNLISPLTVFCSRTNPHLSQEEVKSLQGLLKDPGAWIWTDHTGSESIQDDPAYIRFFDQYSLSF